MPAFTLGLTLLLALAAASWVLLPDFWARQLLRLSRARAGLSSHHTVAGDIRWHCLRSGQHGPTLLLLHGFGADTSCWLRIAPLLRPHFSLLIPDLPGFGESEPPHSLKFDIETQADRLDAFLADLGVEQCIVAGNSMGGYLAAALTARGAGRVRALWLLAPLGVRSAEPGAMLSAIDAGDLEQLQVRSVHHFRTRILPTMFSSRPHLPGPLIRSMAHSAMARQNETPRMLHETRFDSEPLESIAEHISIPVLLQWGEDDQVVSPAGMPVLKSVLASALTALTPHCGHLPMLERPRESADLFLEFAREHALY